MSDLNPPVRRVKVHCAFKKAPCPHCGIRGNRKDTHQREVRSIAYGEVLYLDLTYGEYRARCGCCKTFCNAPEGIDLRRRYDNKVRQAVLDRILQDGMNAQTARAALKRDFLLDLSEGFVYDCLRSEVARLDMAEYRQWALERFSGVLCVDELHLGRYTLLLATDPLHDFPVAFALVDANDGEHMRRFLTNLKHWGLWPHTVITDGSNLYPKLLEELWPHARHQLCVFHVIQDINKLILDAVKRLRRELARRGRRGRKRKRGRPRKQQQAQRKGRQKRLKEQAHFVFKRRFLIVKRREKLTPRERKDLQQMQEYLPALQKLRTFADRIYRLFEAEQTEHQARCRRAALLRDPQFSPIPELAQVREMLTPEKFAKMTAFLKSPAAQRVRTNNHVERANRRLRYYEKVRYKWRRRRTIVRFVILALVRWRREHPLSERDAPSPAPPRRASATSSNRSQRSVPDSFALSG